MHRHSRSALPRSSAAAEHRRSSRCRLRCTEIRRRRQTRPRYFARGRDRRTSRRESFRAAARSRGEAKCRRACSGSRSMKPAMSSRSNFRRGANIQRIGPSFGPSAAKPCAKKLPMPSPPSASFDRVTQKREPLIANWKAVGDRFRPSFPALRLLPAVEGGVDLDRGELARRIFELFRLRRACRDRRPRATAHRSSRRCRCGFDLRSS